MKLEEAIEDIKAHLIDLCAFPNHEEDNYNAGYIAAIDENTSEIFKAGVEFTQRWIPIQRDKNGLTTTEQDNDFLDNLPFLVKSKYGIEVIEEMTMDLENVEYTHWRPIELK